MENTHFHDHHFARILKYILIIFGIALIVLFVFLFREYQYLKRARIINMRESFFTNLIHKQGPLTANNANLIRSWMTFDYINKTFNIPADYLKAQFRISNMRYPLISISGYARSQNINPDIFLNSVIESVQNYLTIK